jgi:hypothetical protein
MTFSHGAGFPFPPYAHTLTPAKGEPVSELSVNILRTELKQIPFQNENCSL